MKKATIYYSDTLMVNNLTKSVLFEINEKLECKPSLFIVDCTLMINEKIKEKIEKIKKSINCDTNVVQILNVPKKFDYANILYSVSEGVKNENSESPLFPKFIITTKFLPKFDASSKRRCDVFELKKID